MAAAATSTSGKKSERVGFIEMPQQRRSRIMQMIRPCSRIRVVVALLLLLLLLFILCWWFFFLLVPPRYYHDVLLGVGPTISLSGGDLGKRFDNSIRTVLFVWRQKRIDYEFHRRYYKRKITKTNEPTNEAGVPVLTESYTRHATAMQSDAAVSIQQEEDEQSCSSSSDLLSGDDEMPLQMLLHPLVGDWYRPIDWWTDNNDGNDDELTSNNKKKKVLLTFDAAAMDQFMYRNYYQNNDDDNEDDDDTTTTTLWDIYQELSSTKQRVELWALCAVYHYGGIFVGPTIRSNHSLTTTLQMLRPFRDSNNNNDYNGHSNLSNEDEGNSCQSKKNVSSLLWFQQQQNRIVLLAANQPKNPRLHCLFKWLQRRASKGGDDNDHNDIDWRRFWLWTESALNQQLHWDTTTSSCETWQKSLDHSYPTVRNLNGTSNNDKEYSSQHLSSHDSSLRRWTVHVREAEGTPQPQFHATKRKRWSERLPVDLNCKPSWWCHRCLRMPWFGSFARCRRICKCYAEHLCSKQRHQDDPQQPREIVMHAVVKERRNSTDKRIPKIIHQTWFEKLTTKEYPHLQRLQHSWKAAYGWDYRFYTDEMARSYIQQHFPKRFADAYDAIVVPAFRADFFRLCVLAIDGGVYSDIDVQLDVNLDSFITQNLSFFVPRDTNIDYWPNSNYCAWNGLMGASPGHPIVIQALQSLLNRALNRQDYLDIESEMCQRDLTNSIWKLRCSPMLLLTGPCALGISVSDALGRANPLEGWQFGWQPTDRLGIHQQHDGDTTTPSSPNHQHHDWGDVLMLLLDRYDMGELRFTDIGRNLLVASTNQDRIVTRPLSEQRSSTALLKDAKPPKTALHYSNFESDVVGMRAYKDDQWYNERIRIEIKHENV